MYKDSVLINKDEDCSQDQWTNKCDGTSAQTFRNAHRLLRVLTFGTYHSPHAKILLPFEIRNINILLFFRFVFYFYFELFSLVKQ